MAQTKRKANNITGKDLDEVLALTNLDCQKTSVFMEYFGTFDGKQRFHTYDMLSIPPKTYHNNKNTFTTTIGSWFFNKACIDEAGLFDILGYINQPINKKVYKDITAKLSYAINEDRATVQQFKKFIIFLQKFMNYSTVICTTTSEDYLLISKTIEKEKNALLKKYEKQLQAGDAYTMKLIEDELLALCEEKLKDDPAWDNIASGAGADLGNHFKNMYVIKGAQKDPDPTKGYNIITSCYSEGVSKEDYSKMANSLAAGPYSRAKKTATWGYEEKKYLNAFQHITLGPKGSDCGTTRTIEVVLDNKMMSKLMYSYIVESGNRLVRLDSTTMDKYRNKKVKVRFSSLCKNEHICNKCAGDLYYILGVNNIGTATPQLASAIKNVVMGSFHDSTEKYLVMDPNKAFGEL